MGKGENAGDQHFLLFPIFSAFYNVKVQLFSNLEKSKILSFYREFDEYLLPELLFLDSSGLFSCPLSIT